MEKTGSCFNVVDAFIYTGKVWYSADEDIIEVFRKTVCHDGKMNPDVIGHSAVIHSNNEDHFALLD